MDRHDEAQEVEGGPPGQGLGAAALPPRDDVGVILQDPFVGEAREAHERDRRQTAADRGQRIPSERELQEQVDEVRSGDEGEVRGGGGLSSWRRNEASRKMIEIEMEF